MVGGKRTPEQLAAEGRTRCDFVDAAGMRCTRLAKKDRTRCYQHLRILNGETGKECMVRQLLPQVEAEIMGRVDVLLADQDSEVYAPKLNYALLQEKLTTAAQNPLTPAKELALLHAEVVRALKVVEETGYLVARPVIQEQFSQVMMIVQEVVGESDWKEICERIARSGLLASGQDEA